jgi:CDP-paratose 2-epimerase
MKLLVTGAGGLIGSEVVSFFSPSMTSIIGIDANLRKTFFGSEGDISKNIARLSNSYSNFTHCNLDIRDQDGIFSLLEKERPDFIVHAAAQPSHDYAAKIPLDDFDINARATLILLEATRKYCPEAVFVFLSTNKVYGDRPNKLELVELETRWDFKEDSQADGIDESMSIDNCMHSLFGVSKAAADLAVQEYGRYFGLKTVCLRGGCLTGPQHAGVELHGFLSYLIKCALSNREYNVYGYKGKQVRDNIHCYDVATAISEIFNNPRCGEVYNLGGGRENSCSILEASSMVTDLCNRKIKLNFIEQARSGDHICYISNMNKFKNDYPNWKITKDLPTIFRESIANFV